MGIVKQTTTGLIEIGYLPRARFAPPARRRPATRGPEGRVRVEVVKREWSLDQAREQVEMGYQPAHVSERTGYPVAQLVRPVFIR